MKSVARARPRKVSLDFNFLDVSEEAEKQAAYFFKLCQAKFRKGEVKYGYLSTGKVDYRRVYDHLLCEFGELILAMDGDDWRESVIKIIQAINERKLRGDGDRDPVSELADVTNIPVLVYVCGVEQKAKEFFLI